MPVSKQIPTTDLPSLELELQELSILLNKLFCVSLRCKSLQKQISQTITVCLETRPYQLTAKGSGPRHAKSEENKVKKGRSTFTGKMQGNFIDSVASMSNVCVAFVSILFQIDFYMKLARILRKISFLADRVTWGRSAF